MGARPASQLVNAIQHGGMTNNLSNANLEYLAWAVCESQSHLLGLSDHVFFGVHLRRTCPVNERALVQRKDRSMSCRRPHVLLTANIWMLSSGTYALANLRQLKVFIFIYTYFRGYPFTALLNACVNSACSSVVRNLVIAQPAELR